MANLTHTQITQAKPEKKTVTLSDGQGLAIQITPSGSKRWRWRYQFQGKAKMLSLGLFPEVSLSDARQERDRLRAMAAKGIDPSLTRKLEKVQVDRSQFGPVAQEWFDKFKGRWTDAHARTAWQRIEANLLPYLKDRPINEITPAELLHVVRKVEERGALEQARRVLSLAGQIFRYGVSACLCDRDPSQDLRGALTPRKKRNFPCITDPAEVGALMRAIETYPNFVTRLALQFQAMTMTRPGEIRFCEWTDIDLDTNTWTIPPEKMKAGREHVVPLSRQAGELLREIHPLTGNKRYVFCFATQQKPMSENTQNTALRRLGYSKEVMVAHGFRGMASTVLNEMGHNPELIEVQLAHVGKDKIRAAYCRAQYLEKRRELMQSWSDILDGLRAGGNVVPLRRVG